MTTYEEYLAYEIASELKHEFEAGKILPKPGVSLRHSALAVRIGAAIGNDALPPGCIGFQSDLRIRVLAAERAAYPDVSVVCGPIELDPADSSGTTFINPTLIVEILSPLTEKIDRGGKWRDYQRIPSLREYVLVSQDPRIEIYRRATPVSWEYIDVREGVVKLATGPTLDLSMLYSGLPL